ncbi:hypothetical protein AALO_G00031070 [Alosa alosa]|uniref:Uncharacterized protein n=1 Tax=Alosa alosa TaxID=278164 RepID=A0AAV6HBV0_9TELE|nr:hypothetical protein AALO_G00031070 [Alosa alosa]
MSRKAGNSKNMDMNSPPEMIFSLWVRPRSRDPASIRDTPQGCQGTRDGGHQLQPLSEDSQPSANHKRERMMEALTSQ